MPDGYSKFWEELNGKSIKSLADEFVPLDSRQKTKAAISHSKVYGLLKKGKDLNMESGLLFAVDHEK